MPLHLEGKNNFNNISQNSVSEECVWKWRLFRKLSSRKSLSDKIWDSRVRKKETVIMFEKPQLIAQIRHKREKVARTKEDTEFLF